MTTLDISRILSLLPHRYPFLLVDRVVECIPGERLVAVKNVTVNEPHFTGHFPERAVMPGVLIIEALAQATGLLAMETVTPDDHVIYLLVGIDKARFKRQVEPGDQLQLEAKLLKRRRDIWVFDCVASVAGQLVATAEIMCTARAL